MMDKGFDITQFVASVRDAVSASVDITEDPKDEEILERVRSEVFNRSRVCALTVIEKKEAVDRVFNSLRRLDILQPLLEDDNITEIMINGPEMVFVEREGKVKRLDARFESGEKLEGIIQTIVSSVNRSVNESTPIADARLRDGSRVSVVMPPVAINGPILTIRKFAKDPITMEKLIKSGSISAEAAGFLKMMVRAKYNIFVCGGTGSGKTTMLNVLSNFIPQDERIITIEDSAELQIVSVPNRICMETRDANTEGKGRITIRDLIRASLRMRPDRIIVGEVRGEEALDMLQAMNTGHDGSLSTGHGNSAVDMLSRLETMVLSGASMPLEAIRKQISSAVDIVVHLGRTRDRSRKVLEISEVLPVMGGDIPLNPIFQYKEECHDGHQSDGVLVHTGNSLRKSEKLIAAGISPELIGASLFRSGGFSDEEISPSRERLHGPMAECYPHIPEETE